MNNFKNLVNALLEKSESTDFETATHEWYVSSYNKEQCKCVCGKENIINTYMITNVKNGNILGPIGSHCVNHFNINDAEIAMKILAKKNTIFNNPGKQYDGMTYSEVCKNRNYIEFIRKNSKKAKYQKLLEYYDYISQLN